MTIETLTPGEATLVQSPEDSNKIIQGLWIGTELSVMEQLSVASFLRNGHEYHLYIYDEIKNIPAGTVIKDASEILPPSRIFQYKHFPTYAGFANFFRYKLLLEHGGWWVDTDTICLKPFDFPEEHIFATEKAEETEVVTSGIIKAPVGSQVMAYAWEVCQSKQPEQLVWGETGPRLMGEAVRKFSLEKYAQPHHTFCPLAYYEWHKLLEPDANVLLDESTYAIHLWNEKWRAAGQDKNLQYHENCLYEQLKKKYLHPQVTE
jgi:mannosyltransferase OCH1-like enzyme